MNKIITLFLLAFLFLYPNFVDSKNLDLNKKYVALSFDENKEKDPTITKEYIDGISKILVPEGEDPKDPKYSPLYGDFKGFPPTLILSFGSILTLRATSVPPGRTSRRNSQRFLHRSCLPPTA